MKKQFFVGVIGVLTLFVACSKDKAPALIDDQLYDLAIDTVGYSWYYHIDTLLPRSSGSGHSESYLKTRYNATAANYLDNNGRVLPNTIFPNGSVIVKELINEPGTVHRYAILWKNSSSEFTDANGWVWGYINGDQTVEISAALKGSSCISCHSQAGNIDQTLMNANFP